jgi:hypothetical protein
MGRQATIWFRRQTGWYMTTVAGVQHKLVGPRPMPGGHFTG